MCIIRLCTPWLHNFVDILLYLLLQVLLRQNPHQVFFYNPGTEIRTDYRAPWCGWELSREMRNFPAKRLYLEAELRQHVKYIC